jgi:Zn-finger nucleic acid-binding protein
MNKYRLICPHCGATLIATCLEEVMWELCPGCYRHVWDSLDLKMAEPVTGQSDGGTISGLNTTLSN